MSQHAAGIDDFVLPAHDPYAGLAGKRLIEDVGYLVAQDVDRGQCAVCRQAQGLDIGQVILEDRVDMSPRRG